MDMVSISVYKRDSDLYAWMHIREDAETLATHNDVVCTNSQISEFRISISVGGSVDQVYVGSGKGPLYTIGIEHKKHTHLRTTKTCVFIQNSRNV